MRVIGFINTLTSSGFEYSWIETVSFVAAPGSVTIQG